MRAIGPRPACARGGRAQLFFFLFTVAATAAGAATRDAREADTRGAAGERVEARRLSMAGSG